MKGSFSTYHPLVNFLYFGLVLLFSMFFLHPVCIGISLCAAVLWSIRLKGARAIRFFVWYLLPTLLFMALLNPAFNHEGITILAYLPSGNPLTLESILYGLISAAMLCAVFCWFSCYNEIMTSDKFIYLFGRIIPALSLILSMTLRFVPRFQAQLKVVSNAQKCVGRDVSDGSLIARAKHGLKILSIMISWALESAIETADSMKSRGYGLRGRTAFSIYRMEERDKTMLWSIALLGGYIVAMGVGGGFSFRCFPSVQFPPWDAWSISGFLAYGALCALPLILDLWEERKWKHSVSNI